MRLRLKDPAETVRECGDNIAKITPYLNWLYRWPFISPALSAAGTLLGIESRAKLETAIEVVADLLVASDPIEVPPCITTYAIHLSYLICLLAAGQSNENSLYDSMNLDQSSMNIGSYHYHTRQALMGWDGAVLTLFQSLWEVAGGEGLEDWEAEEWESITEAIERIFYARIMCYELSYCGRACGFSVSELETDLIRDDVLQGPLLLAVRFDDLDTIESIRAGIEERNTARVWKTLRSVFGSNLGYVGKVNPIITKWFAFGTEDFDQVFYDVEPKPTRDPAEAERWESIKSDLKNVTEAMVGILPPEDVFNKFTSFLNGKNENKNN
ncbi:hypothetical protein GNI_160400 [Gregarina niphandrodes]|uniref:Uncharacterized protein n=1 Tax=Gregarina niphandrodes TaxID=110365 RepID=A0A023AZ24_GRENI|nr:hypothetical protein GNI_160400 [Gregarina niphandrodes]EZG43753.1 hypothetical protein GNI_160400 [Gregarina niphandrodes]|eukprot:XP_011134638.1 hypothetical protein GNI_160400 [Gregarina niphandrodes]